jgi:hypothetical protein
MNEIKSDKIGRHIHSPFVYRLVANVIFAPYQFYSFSEIDKMAVTQLESDELKIIFRLVNFFRFKEVYCIGNYTNSVEKTCKMAKPDLIFFHQEGIPEQESLADKLNFKRLLIWDFCDKVDFTGWVPENPEVWILQNLDNPNQNNFFSILKIHQKVKITLRLNNQGIVIFKEIFEKENYVIKY